MRITRAIFSIASVLPTMRRPSASSKWSRVRARCGEISARSWGTRDPAAGFLGSEAVRVSRLLDDVLVVDLEAGVRDVGDEAGRRRLRGAAARRAGSLA